MGAEFYRLLSSNKNTIVEAFLLTYCSWLKTKRWRCF